MREQRKASSEARVREICERETGLSESGIRRILEVVSSMPMMADVTQANVFIDCLMKDGQHAIVVAEAAPATAQTLYQSEVVGLKAYEAFEPAVLQCLRSGKPVLSNRAITQEGKHVEQSVTPVRRDGGEVIGALIMEKDISAELERESKMEQLAMTAKSLSHLLVGHEDQTQPFIAELVEEALFFVDKGGRILFSNPPAINLLHDLADPGTGGMVHIQDRLPMIKTLLFSSEPVQIGEIHLDKRTFRVKKIRLPDEGAYSGVLFVLKDVTELREKEAELMMKSVAIQEIHHRVKNNMQTVASLVRLQMRKGIPEESKVYFKETLNRILSIASVYEVILSNSQIDEINLRELLDKIAGMFAGGGSDGTCSVTVSSGVEGFMLDSERAVPVALITNELIQNSVNHAFPAGKKGEVTVKIEEESGRLTVTVEDTGTGFNERETSESLGLTIVRRMAEHDLNGSFVVESSPNGTVACYQFPVERRD